MGLMALGVITQGKRLSGSCGGNPDSVHCGCSPAKRAACRERALENADHFDVDDEPSDGREDVFERRSVTEENLAPPGERRLIQLRTGRE
jgi:hypothetical protein